MCYLDTCLSWTLHFITEHQGYTELKQYIQSSTETNHLNTPGTVHMLPETTKAKQFQNQGTQRPPLGYPGIHRIHRNFKIQDIPLTETKRHLFLVVHTLQLAAYCIGEPTSWRRLKTKTLPGSLSVFSSSVQL